MPVYNSGIYLKTAIESVLSQTLCDIELILVDDGSTDGSSVICDAYAQKDPRVVVIHQNNGGISNARNVALACAKGEYIGFSDHDDKFSNVAYEKAYLFAKSKEVDIVKFGHKAIKTKGRVVLKIWTFRYAECVYSPDDAGAHYLEMLQEGQMECVWDSLYRKDFLVKNNLIFNTAFKAGDEDVDFNGRAIACMPKVGIMSDVFYYHYVRVGFSTSTKFKEVNITNILSFANRLRMYLIPYNTNKIFSDNPVLYADTVIHRSVGSLLYCTTMPACHYTKEKIFGLLEEIRNDHFIHPCFFTASKLKFLCKDMKYFLLYIAFLHRKYGLCLILYNMRNCRDKMKSLLSMIKK